MQYPIIYSRCSFFLVIFALHNLELQSLGELLRAEVIEFSKVFVGGMGSIVRGGVLGGQTLGWRLKPILTRDSTKFT